MTADGGHLHLDVNMCWLYAYTVAGRLARDQLKALSASDKRS